MGAVNLGRNQGWIEGGTPYKMWWNPAITSSRTADDSKRMHGQIVEATKPFMDPLDHRTYMTPPMRPNDRCGMRPLHSLPENVILIAGQMYDRRYVQQEAMKYV